MQYDLPIEKVKEYADNFAEIWDEIFPIERQRILGLFLEQVVVYEDHVDIEIKTGGLATFIEEMTNGNDWKISKRPFVRPSWLYFQYGIMQRLQNWFALPIWKP